MNFTLVTSAIRYYLINNDYQNPEDELLVNNNIEQAARYIIDGLSENASEFEFVTFDNLLNKHPGIMFNMAIYYNEGRHEYNIKQDLDLAAKMIIKLIHSQNEQYIKLASDYLKNHGDLTEAIRKQYRQNMEAQHQPKPTPEQLKAARPEKVDPKHLNDANGMLLSYEQIKCVKELFYEESIEHGRVVKKIKKKIHFPEGQNDENKSFSVLRIKEGDSFQYYAIYRGKQGAHAGKSIKTKEVYAQNLDTGKWGLVKKIKPYYEITGQKNKQTLANIELDIQETREASEHESRMLTIAGLGHGLALVRYEDPTIYRAYIVMDIAPGESLFKYLHGLDELAKNKYKGPDNKDQRPSDDHLLLIIKNMLEAYNAQVKKKGLIHRDLHSANMMVDEKGMVTIIDFDAAQILDNEGKYYGSPFGTPGFFFPEWQKWLHGNRWSRDAPEVVQDEKLDLYAIGKSIERLAKHINDPIVKARIMRLCQELTNNDWTQRLTYKQTRAVFNSIISTHSESSRSDTILNKKNAQAIIDKIKEIIRLEIKEKPDAFNRIAGVINECENNRLPATDTINRLIQKAAENSGYYFGIINMRTMQSTLCGKLYDTILDIKNGQLDTTLSSLNNIKMEVEGKVQRTRIINATAKK